MRGSDRRKGKEEILNIFELCLIFFFWFIVSFVIGGVALSREDVVVKTIHVASSLFEQKIRMKNGNQRKNGLFG